MDRRRTCATPPLRFLPYRKFETQFEGALAAFMVPAERLVRHAAHDRKHVQHSSDANSEAGLPTRRSGICGRSSFQDDQLPAVSCGALFCAGEMTADGFTSNTPVLTASSNIVPRCGRSLKKAGGLLQSEGLSRRAHEVNHARRCPCSARRTVGRRPSSIIHAIRMIVVPP